MADPALVPLRGSRSVRLSRLAAAVDGAITFSGSSGVPSSSADSTATSSVVAAGVPSEAASDDPIVTDVVHDSTAVPPGALFVAVRGDTRDGHDFAADAVAAGAAAVMVDHVVALGPEVAQLVVADTRVAMAAAAAECWGRPSEALTVIGVTGTNGKTTVVNIIGDLMAALGRRAATIGTLTGARTTPEATDLQPQLAGLVADGVEVVAMEVSSHALALHRVDALDVDVAVFTNLGLDHLDFHGTEQRYFAAKATLFEPDRSRMAVVNVDDVHGRLLRDASAPDRRLVAVSLDDLTDLEVGPDGSRFRWRGLPVSLPLVGRYNVTNAVLAAEACVAIGTPPDAVAAALAQVSAPPGRYELVDAGQPFLVVVDYAHTPDGLERVLEASRELTAGRLIVVFGCGGDRDRTKRPKMGEVAGRLADEVIVTSDNPRSEDPSGIMSAVLDGIVGGHPIAEPDRRAAIGRALDLASPGDVVLIAGKGHETTQTIGDRVVDFDDRVVAREELAARSFGGGA